MLKNNRSKKSWKTILTVIVLFSLGYYLYKNREVFGELKNLTVEDILIVSGLHILMIATYSLLSKKMMDKIDPKVSYGDNFLLQYANNFLNKIIPKGGTVFRGFYLKRVYKFPYSKFLSTVGGLYVITFISYSLLGLISLLFVYLETGLYNVVIMAAFLGLLIGTFFIVLLNPNIDRNKNRVFKVLDDILDGWKTIKHYPKEVIIFVILNFIILFFNTLKIQYLYGSLDLKLNFARSLYLSTVSVITMFISVTPDGIGVNEIFYAFSSDILGIAPERLVFGSLVSRAITTAISLIVGGVCYLILIKKARKKM